MDSKIAKNYFLPMKTNIVRKTLKTKYGSTIFSEYNLFPEKQKNRLKSKSLNEDSTILKLVLENYKYSKNTIFFGAKKGILTSSNPNLYTNVSIPVDPPESEKENAEYDVLILKKDQSSSFGDLKNTMNDVSGALSELSEDANTTSSNVYNYILGSDLSEVPSDLNIKSYSSLRQSRDLLLNWLVKVHQNMRLESETLYIAIRIIDKYLMAKEVQLEHLQLIGVTSLYIAAKYEEVLPPTIFQFSFETDGIFTNEDIKIAEVDILEVLEFNLNYPSPLLFLEKQMPTDLYNLREVKIMAIFLLEVMLIDFRFLGYTVSNRATASVLVASRMYNQTITNITERLKREKCIATLESICKNLIQYLFEPEIHPELIKKFRSPNNFYVAEKALTFIKFLAKKNV
ncbi:G2/mitotic-specific cyclin-2 [Nakaseomyces bracarensis]|uniref:G2/mitotic-specific cyclin-2 n=1 Tax=Nakaseomyces bracarensis TaxID=273131 RepID=A0ABR4NYS3_9SACH